MHYEEKYDVVKDKSISIYKFVNEKVYDPFRDNLYVIYDKTNDYYSFMVKVLKEHQPNVLVYIKDSYNNVHVVISNNWMKLDFDNDGKVSLEDLKKGAADLYEFLVNYDYIEKATEIKNTLYDEAIKYMKADVHNEKEKKESKLDENDQKADNSVKEQ